MRKRQKKLLDGVLLLAPFDPFLELEGPCGRSGLPRKRAYEDLGGSLDGVQRGWNRTRARVTQKAGQEARGMGEGTDKV